MARTKPTRIGKELVIQTLQMRFYQAWALSEIVSSPSRWVYLLESQPGWMSKTALSVVSGIYDQRLLLLGLKVREWSSDKVGLELRSRQWGPWLRSGHKLSDLTAAAELCLRLYWNRYMLSETMSFSIETLQWDGIIKNDDQLHFRYGHSPLERDQLLFELSHRGEVVQETSVTVLNAQEVRLGSFHFVLRFKGPLALPNPLA